MNISIEELERIVEKLVHIRDRAHFHIDRKDLLEPTKVWSQAGVTGDEFIFLTESAHKVLRRMYQDLTGIDRPIPDYHGEDIINIITAYKEMHPDAPLSI